MEKLKKKERENGGFVNQSIFSLLENSKFHGRH